MEAVLDVDGDVEKGESGAKKDEEHGVARGDGRPGLRCVHRGARFSVEGAGFRVGGSRRKRTMIALDFRESPKCGKTVKLFSHGTKVLSLIPKGFHLYTLEDIWRVYSLHVIF